jgi:thiol-disulfide isomerase/thioredoxin
MRRALYLILFLTFTKLNAQEINFETDWKTAIEKGIKEKKLIFMDVYTTWCRPCKIYDKNTFRDSVVAAFYNENFINLKCNAEKDWGIKAAKHYGVSGYPNFLFIDPNSLEVFYKIHFTSQEPKYFKEQGVIANRERNADPLSIMTAEYGKGRRDMAFLKKMMHRKANTNIDFTDELLEFMRIYSLNELTKDYSLGYHSLKIKYGSLEYLQIRAAKKRNIDIGSILIHSVNAIMDTAIKRKDEALMESMLAEMNFLIGLSEQKKDYLRIDFHQKTENFSKAFTFTEGYISRYLLKESLASIRTNDSIFYGNCIKSYTTGQRDSVGEKEEYEYIKRAFANNKARLISSQIHDLLSPVIFKITDKEALKKILKWAALSVELEPSFFNTNQLYAIALYKNGENADAIKKMEIAIEQYRLTVSENEFENAEAIFNKMKEQLSKMKSNTL